MRECFFGFGPPFPEGGVGDGPFTWPYRHFIVYLIANSGTTLYPEAAADPRRSLAASDHLRVTA